MAKITIIIALVYVTIATARDTRFGQRLIMNGDISSRVQVRAGTNQWSSKLCGNDTLAKEFLSEIQQMITTLEADHDYDRVLLKRVAVIAYLKNTANGNTLSSNCTEYFNGYKNAQKLDQKTEDQQMKFEANLDRLFKKILLPLVGARSLLNSDF
ncbi:hypothetical protein I4U23_012503 [Adineta vaga]|nr:hypothetical protein I4U23_012503 [Adineta vaga]